MKLIAKQLKIDLTPFSRQGEQTIKHTQICDVFCINQSQICLLRLASILVFDYSTLSFVREIELGKINKVVYLREINRFCGYDSQLRNLVLFENCKKPTFTIFYSFTQHKKYDREWNPSIFRFQSPYFVLIRQFYGQSSVIIFDINKKMEIIWQFNCCQTSLSKLDQIEYLVNFRQFNSQRKIQMEIYNINLKGNQTYKIEGIPQNIVKSIKMYENDQLQKIKRNQQIRVAIGVSYQTLGCGILIVKLFSEGNYEIVSNIVSSTFEIYKLLKSDQRGNIVCLAFRFDELTRTTKLNLTNFSLDLNNNQIIICDQIQVQSTYEHLQFNNSQQLLITLSNHLSQDKQQNRISNIVHLGYYKNLSKRSAYIHLCQQLFKDFSINSISECLNCLD